MMALLLAACAFATVVLIFMYFAARIREREVKVAERLFRASGRAQVKEKNADDRSFGRRVLGPALKWATTMAARMTPGAQRDEIRRRLAQAGNPWGLQPLEFVGIKLLGMIALPLVMIVLGLGLPGANGDMQWVLVDGAALLLGAMLPEIMIKRQIADRQKRIAKELPDVLDLLTVSVEAGLGFDASMAKVSEKSKGPLAEEFRRVLQEMRMGKPRREALRDLGTRTGVDDLITFTVALVQADQLGVSIGKVLRVQSEEMRRKRRQRAEEAAMKAPIKMVFPLVFFVFPTLFIILLGPALIHMLELFTGVAEAAGPTVVVGHIQGNEVWYESESPYIVTGDLAIAPGATLTIEPGVSVLFRTIDNPKFEMPWTRGAVMRVMGNLVAVGTSAKPILFSLQDSQDIGGWGGIFIDGAYGGTATIEQIRVEYATRGLFVRYAPISVRESIFSQNLTGIHIEDAPGFLLDSSTLSRNGYALYLDGGDGTISRTTVTGNTWGVYLFNSDGYSIEHNDIKSNNFGVIYDGGRGDRITYNDFSVKDPNDFVVYIRHGKPEIIEHNNFHFDEKKIVEGDIDFWFLFNESTSDISAPRNWWSTTNPDFIDHYIFDEKDDPRVGLVRYTPIMVDRVEGTIDDLRPPEVHILSRVVFSPNGDGRMDVAAIDYSLSEHALRVEFEIIDRLGLAGPANQVLMRRVFCWDPIPGLDCEEDRSFARDGVHTVHWDGRAPGPGGAGGASGPVVPDGEYTVRIRAYDTSVPESFGEAERAVIVDTTPPILEILRPANRTRTSLSVVEVSGRVIEADTAGLIVSVDGEPAQLSAGDGAWTHFTGEAILIDQFLIVVQAADGAGNRTQQTIEIDWQPAMTLEVSSPTNEERIAATGSLRTGVPGSQVVDVRARVRDPLGQWGPWVSGTITGVDPTRRFETEPELHLRRGRNLVLVAGFDGFGEGAEMIASIAAFVEYDPYANQELEHTFAPGLRMITLPLVPNTNDHKAALGLPLAEPLRLARLQEEDGRAEYALYGTDGGATIEGFAPGRGFWLELDRDRFPHGHTTVLKGSIADPFTEREIPIRAGWNQIGNPFLHPIPWHDVQVKLEGGRPVPWQTAVENGWIRASLWGYDGLGYRLASTMSPWEGYWVKATRDVTLVVPAPQVQPASFALMGGPAQVGSSSTPLDRYLKGAAEAGGWAIRLGLRWDEGADMENLAGVSPAASTGFDPFYDVEKPPHALDSARIYFESQGSPMAVDMRATSDGPVYAWPVRLDVDEPGEYAVEWLGLQSLPAGSKAVLVDETTGARHELRGTGSLPLQLEEAGVYPFSLQVMAAPELDLTQLVVFPNPSDLSAPVSIRFHLTAEAVIRAGVYDTAGRRIRQLPTIIGGPGVVTLQWDGRTSEGKTAANGLYFVTIYLDAQGWTRKFSARLAVLK